MKYQISGPQRHFFENNHYIQFEAMLTEEECAALVRSYGSTGQKRDLVQIDPAVKKILCSPLFGQIASELCMKKPLRYVFDEVLSERVPFDMLAGERCIQGIEIGMILCLEKTLYRDIEAKNSIFPFEVGSATFFLPDLNLSELTCSQPHFCAKNALLVGWANKDAIYIYNQKDPYAHELKRLGYGFGDRLKNSTHPIVWR